MVEIGNRASFGQIRLSIFRLRDQLGVWNLYGDGSVQLLVTTEIHKAKATLAQQLLYPAATNPIRLLRPQLHR